MLKTMRIRSKPGSVFFSGWTCAFLLYGLFFTGLHGTSPAEAGSSPNVLTLTTPDSDGVFIRYSAMVFNELGRRIQMDITVKPLPKVRTLVMANDGDYDGLANRVLGLDISYPNLIRVKVSHLSVLHILYAKEPRVIDQARDFKGLHDCLVKNDYTVGFLGGSAKAAQELLFIPEKNKVALNFPEQAFGMLDMGRIAAYLAGPGMVNRVIFKEKFARSRIREVGVFSRFPLFSYLHKRHASLVPVFETAIQSMLDDGTIERLRNVIEEK